MAKTWLSREAAAAALGVSIRQLQRRIASGRLESRLTADGRREVLVDAPEDDAGVTGDTRALVLAGSHRQLAERIADHAEVETRRARRIGAVAWSVVAIMLVAIIVGVTYGTRLHAQNEALTTRLGAVTRRAGDIEGHLSATRRRLEDATVDLRVAEARNADLATKAAQAAIQAEQLRTALATAEARNAAQAAALVLSSASSEPPAADQQQLAQIAE